jgi:hypothetical protein
MNGGHCVSGKRGPVKTQRGGTGQEEGRTEIGVQSP